MIAVSLRIELRPEAFEAMRARFLRRLFGRAKYLGAVPAAMSSDAGSPSPMKPALLPCIDTEGEEVCSACDGAGEQLRYEEGPLWGVLTPCSRCREEAFLSFVSRYAYNLALREQAEDEREAAEPSTLRSSDLADGVNPAAEANPRLTEPAGEVKPSAGSAAVGRRAEPDPWDEPWSLADEEEQPPPARRLSYAEQLEAERIRNSDGHPRRPPSLARDRANDEWPDDKSDIQPFGRTTSYPWEPR